MKKRYLSLLLAAAMLCTMLPVQAFAADPVPTPETAGSVETAEVPAEVPASPETAGEAVPADNAQPIPEATPETADEAQAAPETAPDVPTVPQATPETADEVQAEPEQTPETAEVSVLSLDEGMPLELDEPETTGLSDPVELVLNFRERGVSFEGSTSSYRNSFWFARPTELTEKQWATYQFTLAGPDGTAEEAVECILAGANNKYGLLTGHRPAGPGKYTLTVKDEDGSPLASGSVDVIAVRFDTDGKGVFDADNDDDGNDQLHTSYYKKPTSKYDAYLLRSADVPGVTVTDQGYLAAGREYIGWGAAADMTEVDADWNKSLYEVQTVVNDLQPDPENTYTVHAVYGEKKTFGFSIKQGDEVFNLSEPVDLGPAEVGYDPDEFALTLDLCSTGTSNGEIELTQIKGPSADRWTVECRSGDDLLGNSLNVSIPGGQKYQLVIKPRKGLPAGAYPGPNSVESLQFRVSPLSMICTVQFRFVVNSNKITVKVPNSTKPYGQELKAEDIEGIEVRYEASQKPCTIPLEELGLDITSEGFLASANAGSYAYKIGPTSAAGFEVVEAPGCGRLTVTKIEPAYDGIEASKVHVGSELSASQLSGTFTGPSGTVNGDLEWETPTQLVGDKETTKPFRWKFTPTGPDAQNYETVSGSVDVEIITKEATVLSRRPESATTVDYDRQTHVMQFTSNRPDGEESPITVEYFRQDDSGAWEPVEGLPVQAGTYEVRASIAESRSYASATHTETLVIKKLPVTVGSVDQISSKRYDGTTVLKTSVVLHLSGALPGDVVNFDFSAALEKADASSEAVVIITLNGLTGRDAANYQLPDNNVIRKTTIVYPATLTLTNPPTITKEYGVRRLLEAEEFKGAFTGLQGDDKFEDLGLTLRSTGEAAVAAVNRGEPYPITATITNTNYTFSQGTNSLLSKENCGSIVITKATPKENGISVGAGHRGCPLAHASLTGSFVNPNNSEMPVPGTLEWVDPTKVLPKSPDIPSYEAQWKFTPKDQDNYIIPENGTVTIMLQDQDPVHIEVQGDTSVVYDGEPHRLSAVVTPSAVYRVSYRPKGSTEGWTSTEPVHAGEYEVLIAADGTTDASGENFAPNQVTATLTITKRRPDYTAPDSASPVVVPRGTLLDSERVNDLFSFYFKDEKVEGTITWQATDAAITQDCSLVWAFVPASSDFAAVGGVVAFAIEPDYRTVSAQVYNLPELPGLRDYAYVPAVSDAGALKAGDEITFYKDELCTDPVNEAVTVTEADIDNGFLLVLLDGDALAHDANGEIYGRISSSAESIVSRNIYFPEPAFKLEDTGNGPAESVMVHPGLSTRITAELLNTEYNAYYQSISYDFVLSNAGTPPFVTMEGDSDTERTLSGHAQGSGATLTVTVTFRYPDADGHAGDLVSLTDTVDVACAGTIDAVPHSETGAPEVTLDAAEARDALETGTDREALKDGKKITYRLDVANDGTTHADQNEQSTVEKTAADDGYRIGCHLDITVTRYVNDEPDSGITPDGPAAGDDGKITKTANPLTLTIWIPDKVLTAAQEAFGTPEFAVYRLHDGKVELLPDLDGNGNDTVTISTDMFSLYSIVYHKAPVRKEPPRDEDSDSHSSGKETAAPIVRPVVTIPQTSDESTPALWRFAFLASALGLCVTGFFLIKRRRKNK